MYTPSSSNSPRKYATAPSCFGTRVSFTASTWRRFVRNKQKEIASHRRVSWPLNWLNQSMTHGNLAVKCAATDPPQNRKSYKFRSIPRRRSLSTLERLAVAPENKRGAPPQRVGQLMVHKFKMAPHSDALLLSCTTHGSTTRPSNKGTIPSEKQETTSLPSFHILTYWR